MVRLVSLALVAFLSSASAFVAPSSTPRAATTSLQMSRDEQEKRFAASVLTAAYIFANAVSMAPAFAAGPDDFSGSSQVIAARSGGRMGGRSAVGTRGASPSYSRPTSSTTIHKTTVIQSPSVVGSPVYVAPPVYGGYGYGVDAGTVGMYSELSSDFAIKSCP